MGGLGFFSCILRIAGVGVSFINLPFSAWMGARALLTVCRFENLVTGLNLLKQFEFHVKEPLRAHICSASRSVPPLSPAGKHRVPWGQQTECGSWGCWKRAGRLGGLRREKKRGGGKLRGVGKLGAANLNKQFYQPPKKFSCRMKFWGNFGVQVVLEETLPDSNGPDCIKPNLFSYKSRENKFRLYPASPIPGGEEDDGHCVFSSIVWGDWAQEGCSHQPSHYSIIIPYRTGSCSTGRSPLHGVFRVVLGMCDSNHTTPGVMDRAWPQGCGHCKSGCPQARCGSICWSVCYGCSL